MPEIIQFMENYDCPVEATLDVIGGKWKGIILSKLMHSDALRYSEIKRMMPKITARTLTRQLRELERDGIIHRKVYPEVPPKVEYSVTELGKTLHPVARLLNQWGKDNIQTVLDNRAKYEKDAQVS